MPRTILVAEDDRTIRESLRDLLEIEGFESVPAENGRIALDVLRGRSPRPAVLILDLMMPVCTGYEVLDSLRESGELGRLPTIILSAVPGGKATAEEYGTGFVRKPIDVEALLSAIENALPAA